MPTLDVSFGGNEGYHVVHGSDLGPRRTGWTSRRAAAAGVSVFALAAAAVLLLSSQEAPTPPESLVIRSAAMGQSRPPSASLEATQGASKDTGSDNIFTDSVSVPSVGVFTGHRHGEKGGKLTFGRHTYHNVFSKEADELDGCNPGTFGKTLKDGCTECPADSWCPGDQRSFECPEHCTSFPGSYQNIQCECVPGWYGPNTGCQACLAMSYCPGGLNIHGCPAHSESIPEQTECICSAGFWSEDGDHLKCTPCPEGAFCPGENTKEDCPADSTSPVGSKEVGECLCLPAFYEEVPREDPTAAPACVTCPAGAYCPGGADKTPCPSDTFSPVGAGQMAQCLCNAGLFGTAGQCVTCSVNSYCLGGFEPTACPDNTESVAGVEAVDGCTCVAGFFGTTACDVCPAGEKCTGGDAKGMCPALTDSDPGASVCTCVAGYYGPETECEECHSGQYCIGNGIEQACPDDTLAGKGGTSIKDCKCPPGKFGTGGYDCHTCDPGFICTGDGAKSECQAQATSPVGATHLDQCICKAGYKPDGDACALCAVGSFCPGSRRELACPAGYTSPEGADNAAACECLPGFSVSAESGVCVQCPAGFYCVGGADKKEECPHAANSDPGAGSTDMCLCPEGYFGTGSVGCTRCPAGQKCAGDGEAEACPLGTTSNAGANSCQCAKGFFGEGEQCAGCPANSFCDGGGDAAPCGEKAFSAAGASGEDECFCDKKSKSSYKVLLEEKGNRCDVYDCKDSVSICTVMDECKKDPVCQGFYSPLEDITGRVCKFKGPKSCMTQRGSDASPGPEYQLKEPKCDSCVAMGGFRGEAPTTMWSDDGRFHLEMQTDGNLVLYGPKSFTWASHTHGSSADRFSVSDDGNVEVKKGHDTVWQSNSHLNGKPGPPYLKMQDNGNLVVYSKDNQPLWDSQTVGKEGR